MNEKKTAIKLLNKYADSYNLLEEENKILRTEIIDLRTNLNINKEIIQGLFQINGTKERKEFLLNKLKEENTSQGKQVEKIQIENEELRSKVIFLLIKILNKITGRKFPTNFRS